MLVKLIMIFFKILQIILLRYYQYFVFVSHYYSILSNTYAYDVLISIVSYYFITKMYTTPKF
jgi:hypothetical protein